MTKCDFQKALSEVSLPEFVFTVEENGYFQFRRESNTVSQTIAGGYNGHFKKVPGMSIDIFFPL